MKVQEAKGVCKDRSKWKDVCMYVCPICLVSCGVRDEIIGHLSLSSMDVVKGD
jgi:hypothetical protein